jgi:hypothetical protein
MPPRFNRSSDPVLSILVERSERLSCEQTKLAVRLRQRGCRTRSRLSVGAAHSVALRPTGGAMFCRLSCRPAMDTAA